MIERKELPIELLHVDVVQSRETAWTGDEEDRRLADSITKTGLLQDLIVRPIEKVEREVEFPEGGPAGTEPEYLIVAGSRRYHAALEAGVETVPCKVIQADDLHAAWTSLTENTERKQLSEQEIAEQLGLIYEVVAPREEPSACPQCGETVANGDALHDHWRAGSQECSDPPVPLEPSPSSEHPAVTEDGRFYTDRLAVRYLAEQFFGRDDEGARSLVEGHLRTANLPPVLQSLFKQPAERSAAERTALENYGVGAEVQLGSGEGKSGTSREVVQLHETVREQAETEAVDPTDAVLETVGEITFEEMSEQELRRTLRDVRQDLDETLSAADSVADQRAEFTETLESHVEELTQRYEEVEPTRPFKKVDVLGPETQRHSRWHVQAMQQRSTDAHGELVRELYQERLAELAEEEGWS